MLLGKTKHKTISNAEGTCGGTLRHLPSLLRRALLPPLAPVRGPHARTFAACHSSLPLT